MVVSFGIVNEMFLSSNKIHDWNSRINDYFPNPK